MARQNEIADAVAAAAQAHRALAAAFPDFDAITRRLDVSSSIERMLESIKLSGFDAITQRLDVSNSMQRMLESTKLADFDAITQRLDVSNSMQRMLESINLPDFDALALKLDSSASAAQVLDSIRLPDFEQLFQRSEASSSIQKALGSIDFPDVEHVAARLIETLPTAHLAQTLVSNPAIQQAVDSLSSVGELGMLVGLGGSDLVGSQTFRRMAAEADWYGGEELDESGRGVLATVLTEALSELERAVVVGESDPEPTSAETVAGAAQQSSSASVDVAQILRTYAVAWVVGAIGVAALASGQVMGALVVLAALAQVSGVSIKDLLAGKPSKKG